MRRSLVIPSLIKRHNIKTVGTVEVQNYTFLAPVLNGDVWSVALPPNRRIRGRVTSTITVGVVEELSVPRQEKKTDHTSFGSQASHYIE